MLQTFCLLPAAVISAFNENTVKCLYPVIDLSSLFTSTHLRFGSSPKTVL